MKTQCENCKKEITLDEKTEMLYKVFGELKMACFNCVNPNHPSAPQNIRSVEQNRYYWGIVIRFITKFKGWTDSQAHGWIKVTWNIETTTTLSSGEYEGILSHIRNHIREFWKLNIPLPNDDLEFLGGRYNWEKLYFEWNPHLKVATV